MQITNYVFSRMVLFIVDYFLKFCFPSLSQLTNF